MFIPTLNLFCLLQLFLMALSLGENCEDINCSNVIDYVCASTETGDGARDVVKYQNICHMRKVQCSMQSVADIQQVPDEMCHIKKELYRNGRRVHDFGIVGSQQACNHTCPTYCVDTYDPVCATILWIPGDSRSYAKKTMINHCHVDLFSCAVGVNTLCLCADPLGTHNTAAPISITKVEWLYCDVTISPLQDCYTNTLGLLFSMQMASLKSLRLLEDQAFNRTNRRFFTQAISLPRIHHTSNISVKELLRAARRNAVEHERYDSF